MIQIAICAIAISIAFAFIFAGSEGVTKFPSQFITLAFISLVTVGSGFILHEMGHKILAIFYGAPARFQMWLSGLVLMMITSFFGMLFAAPGAVYIYSQTITKRQNGVISLAGPLVNLVLTGVFLTLSVALPVKYYLPFELLASLNVWRFGAQLNLILALFNMIPAFPLDGSKIFDWSKAIWLFSTLLMLALATVLISWAYVVVWLILFAIAFGFSLLVFRRRG